MPWVDEAEEQQTNGKWVDVEDDWPTALAKGVAAIIPSFGKAGAGVVQAVEESTPITPVTGALNLLSLGVRPFEYAAQAVSPMPSIPMHGTSKGIENIAKGVEKATPEFLKTPIVETIQKKLGGVPLGKEAVKYWDEALKETEPQVERGTAKAQAVGTVRSVALNVPFLLAGILTKNPQIALMGMATEQAGEQYGELRQAGVEPSKATAGAIGYGLAEYYTEKIPIGYLLNPKLSIGKRILMEMLTDIPGELVATTIEQGIIDTATTNPDKTLGEFIEDLKDTAIQTAMAAPTMSAVAHPTVKWATKQEARMVHENIAQKLYLNIPDETLTNYVQYAGALAEVRPELKADVETLMKELNRRRTYYDPLSQEADQMISDLSQKLGIEYIKPELTNESNMYAEYQQKQEEEGLQDEYYRDKLDFDTQEELVRRKASEVYQTIPETVGQGAIAGLQQTIIQGKQKIEEQADREKLKELQNKSRFLWNSEDIAFYNRMNQPLAEMEGEGNIILARGNRNIKSMEDMKNLIAQKKGVEIPVEQPVVEAEAIPEETLAPESTVIPTEEEKIIGEQVKEKEPWEMTRREIYRKYQDASSGELSTEGRILGDDWQEWNKAQRQLNSKKDDVANKAYDTIERIESKLKPKDRDALYGIGEEKRLTSEDWKTILDEVDYIDDTSPQALGGSLKYAISKVSPKTDIAKLTIEQQGALAAIKEAFDIAQNKGWDTAKISEMALRESAKRFSDPEDALFILRDYLKGKSVSPEVLKDYPELEAKAIKESIVETYGKGGTTKKTKVIKPPQVTNKPTEKTEPQKNIATKVLESAQEVVAGEREVPLSPYQEKVLAINPKNIDMSAKGIKKLVDDFYRRYFFAQDPAVRYVRERVGAEEADKIAHAIQYIAGRAYVSKENLEGKGVLQYGMSGEAYTKYVEGSKSLMNILKPINSKIMYIDYESWRTARTFDALDRFRPDYKMPEGLADKSRAEITRIETKYGEEGMTVFRQIDKEHRQFEIDAILRPLRDVGWLSQEAFDRILSAPEAQYYSSLQREMEDIDKQGFGGQEVIKRRTGTEKEFKVIMSTESTIANLAKAVKLVATQKLNKDFVKLPDIYPDLSEDIYEVPPEWRKVPHVVKAEIDPKMREQLTNMVTKLGGTVETLINIGKNKMGMFEYGLSDLGEETVNRIKLKFATSEQTFAHELGHMIDKKYSLIDKFITGDTTYPEIKRELRKIADQRASEDSSEHFKKYVRSRPEQIAEFIARYLTQPDQARQLAPNAVKKLEAIFHTHSELKELMDIKPSGQSTLASMSDPAWMRMPYPPKGTITVAKNGTKHYYKVPEDVRKALDYYTPHEIHSIVQILSIPAKVLRAGATLTFDFMLRNPVRDQFTAAIYAKYGYVPFWDFGKGIYHIFKKDEIFHEWQASGAGEAFLFSMDRLGVNEKARDLLTYRGRGLKSYNPLEALRYFSGIMEMGTRVGVYGKARAKGATTQEAASEARESTVDFNRIGAEGRAINMMIAFWNANLQGMDIMRRKLFDKRTAGKTMLKIALGITLPSMILWAFNHDDERYKELPSWQKDLFWIINIGKDKPLIRIPKPFELGILFGSLPERLLSFAFDKDAKGMKEVAKSIGAGAIPGVLPTVAAPILENVTNYNFFTGRPLENQTLQGLPKPMRSMYGTTEISKKLGELTNVSPIKLDNMIQGWTGGLGRQFAELADYVLSDKVPEVEKKWYEQAAGVRGFVAREPIGPPSDSVNTFYDIYERTQQADRGFKTLTKAGQSADAKKFFSENKKDIAMASSARKISETLSELRKQVLMVQNNPSMASGTKRMRIDMVYKRMTDVAKTYNKLYNARQ